MGDEKRRNPSWKRDELILALDLYSRNPRASGRKTHPDVIALSETLNGLPIHPSVEGRTSTFRNASGVGLKLANFQAIDPNAGTGMTSVSKLDREIFNEFATDIEKLRVSAASIRELATELPRPRNTDLLDIDDQFGKVEGGIIERIHRTRERNAKLVKQKKQSVLKRTGTLLCEVCDFDFQAVYGNLGKEFAECHHKSPISEMTRGQKTRMNDLAIVCSNCHRMIHRQQPWKTIEALRNIVVVRRTT
jgi:5-methylcytosine-specific restriction protein A